MKEIIIILCTIFVIIMLAIVLLAKESFKQTILGERRDKEKAISTLKKYNMPFEHISDDLLEEISIISKDGYTLKGYLLEKYKKSNKYVILIHGYKWCHYFSLSFAKMFLDEGFNVLSIDSRNHGNSEGKYPSYGYFEKDDILLWTQKLKKRGNFNDLYLGFHGQSMGCATALIAAANCDDAKFVIADCGFSRLKDCIMYTLGTHKWIPCRLLYKILKLEIKIRVGFDIEKVNPIDEIKRKPTLPVLFVHGYNDKRIPYSMSEEMYNQKKGPNDVLFLVKDAIHMECYGKAREQYKKYVRQIINNSYKLYDN